MRTGDVILFTTGAVFCLGKNFERHSGPNRVAAKNEFESFERASLIEQMFDPD